MIGAIASVAAGLASSIIGGVKAGKEKRKAEIALQNEQRLNEDLFNKEYYSDPLERSDNAALLNRLRTMLDKQSKQTSATAAITGATPESVIAAQENSNNTLSDAMGNMAAMNSKYKENVMNRYLSQKNSLYNQQQGMYGQNAQSWTNYMQNGLGTMTSGAASASNTQLNGNGGAGYSPVEYLQSPSNPGVTVPKVKLPTKFGE